MAEETTSDTTMESVARGRSTGAIRCLQCFERISPPPGAETYKCPHCGYEWRVFWIAPDFPRIRGPVWNTNRRLAEEAVKKEEKRRK